jgi:hypothetical protein
MPQYEVLTPLSNGRGKPPHAPGSVVELEQSDAADLVAIKALRPVAVLGQQADGQNADAPAQADGEGNGEDRSLLAFGQKTMAELSKSSHKQLDALIGAEQVEDVAASPGKKPSVAQKAAAITAQRLAKLVNEADEAQLKGFLQDAGFESLEALDLGEDAGEDDIRVALLAWVIGMLQEGA